MEGSINLPGNRVTVGRNGVVSANISAREIVVLGKVRGNMTASDRVDIRGEGSLTGDVVAQRISIEDGAYFKGGIDIRKPGQKVNGEAKESASAPSASPRAPSQRGHNDSRNRTGARLTRNRMRPLSLVGSPVDFVAGWHQSLN